MSSQKNFFQSSFKTLDAFGFQPKLFVDSQTKYKTNFGGLLSFILFVLVTGACWVYGKELYYKENPTSIRTEEGTTHPERFNITNTSMNYCFGLVDLNWKPVYNPQIYNVQFIQREMIYYQNQQGEKVSKYVDNDLNARRCKKEDFGIVTEYFHNIGGIENYYCMDVPETDIEGDFGNSDRFTLVKMLVYPCRNSTESEIVCKPQKDIDNVLKDVYWSYYTSDTVIDPKNYETPFQHVGRNVYGYASSDMFQAIDLNYVNVYMNDNSGIVFDTWKEQRGLQYSSTYKNQKQGAQAEGKFLEMQIRFEKVKQLRIQRKYLNLAEVLANIGGVLKVFMLGFWVLSSFVSEKYYNIQTVNTLFKFEKDNLDKDGDKNVDPEEQKIQSEQMHENQLKFKNILHSLTSIFASKQDKVQKKLLNYSVRKLSYHLDVKTILKKLIEIDKIKMLLLNQEQYELFDYLPKPVINEHITDHEQNDSKTELEKNKIEQQRKVNLLFEDSRTNADKKIEAYKAYKQIQQKMKLSSIDQKILETMDLQLKIEFDNNFKQELELTTGQQGTKSLGLQKKSGSSGILDTNRVLMKEEDLFSRNESIMSAMNLQSPRKYIKEEDDDNQEQSLSGSQSPKLIEFQELQKQQIIQKPVQSRSVITSLKQMERNNQQKSISKAEIDENLSEYKKLSFQ